MESKVKKTVYFIKKHRYVIGVSIFVLWLMFFSRYSIMRYYHYKNEVSDLKEAIEFYKTKDAEYKKQVELMENDSFLEKYAREKYHTKADNEDVFVFEEEE
ncbi:MAG: septum formation initiator family protein [Bacteroidota bacterium]|nr:septum formation initiator family protein [Bacteroidota bacterium]